MSNPKYVIKGNLSESQIEADVASYFSWCTPLGNPGPLRLIDVNEQITGADKKFNAGCTIYMQFKKSTGLHSATTVPISKSHARSRMEDIREFRALNSLEDDPSLFFQLRKKATNAHHLQHNVLMSHEIKGKSRAFYVAPLELDKTKYYSSLFNDEFRFHGDPIWFKRHSYIRDRFMIRHLNCSPFLREHVAITPHEYVHDHNHFYSYSQTGTDICWHSPLFLDTGPSRLSDVMSSIVREVILTAGKSLVNLEELSRSTLEISKELGFDVSNSKDVGALEAIQKHGKLLASTYRIRQFVLLANTGMLRRLQEDS